MDSEQIASRLIEAVRKNMDSARKQMPDEWQDFMVEQVADLSVALGHIRALEQREAGSKGREGARVEAAAEAIHAMQRNDSTVNDWNWADLSERYKDEYRRIARAALAAAPSGEVG